MTNKVTFTTLINTISLEKIENFMIVYIDN
jgi:hypothetical protein